MSGIGDRVRDLLLGARAGLVATALMNLLMLTAKAAGLTGWLPPAKLTDRAAEHVPFGNRLDSDDRNAIAALMHFGFGMGAGALFGFATSGLRHVWLSSALGVVYGTVIYLVSYLGWIPALDIMPSATEDRPGRSLTMLVAHWVYGATLGALTALGDERHDVADVVGQRFG